MKILIAYASKNGTTKACVECLEERLKGKNIKTVCLDNETPSLAEYDMVIVGASVYFGRLRPAARKFLAEHESLLCQKRLALFFCCGLTEEYPYYLEKLFSKNLREHAFQTMYFGGSLKTEGLSFFDKWAVRSMRSELFEQGMENGEYVATLPGILPENIDKMATYIRKEITDFYNG